MRLIIKEDSAAVGLWAAKYVRNRINSFLEDNWDEARSAAGKTFNLGLPTGSTPLHMYKNLVQFCKEGTWEKMVFLKAQLNMTNFLTNKRSIDLA